MEQDGSTLQPSSALLSQAGPGAEREPGLLHLFNGVAATARALPVGGEGLELGRGDAALGATPDPCMSRRHARVRFDGRRFWVTDLGSQNGTFVDGEPAPADAPREAKRVIRLGDSLFVPSADVRPLATSGVAVSGGFVRGPALQRLLDEVARVAEAGLSLHIHGESGAGKEGVARAFHEGGAHKAGPFVAVNCAAIPQSIAERLLFGVKRGAYSGAEADAPGYLQAADGGTLFLDEVVELDLQVQAKLLRVLETREVVALGAARPKAVNLHVCSASHQDMRAQVASGKLREDLYFRLARPELSLPPLRHRPEEIPLLIEREAKQASSSVGLHVSLIEACLLRPWPGNVRELLVEVRSAVRAALSQKARRVKARHLNPRAGTAFGPAAPAPAPLPPPPPSGGTVAHAHAPADADADAAGAVEAGQAGTSREAFSRAKPLSADERARIERALREHGGNVTATARELGLHRTHLRRLIERNQVSIPTGQSHE